MQVFCGAEYLTERHIPHLRGGLKALKNNSKKLRMLCCIAA